MPKIKLTTTGRVTLVRVGDFEYEYEFHSRKRAESFARRATNNEKHNDKVFLLEARGSNGTGRNIG